MTTFSNNWRDDPRLTSGYAALKTKMMLDQGARFKQIGWKLGFGSPSGLFNLALRAPLTGYLLAERALPNEAKVDISEWVKPVGETEIVLYFGRDVPSGANQEFIMKSITALGPAIELADLEVAPTDPTRILATDIFQKNYILGVRDELRPGADITNLTARIVLPDGAKKVVTELEEYIGALPAIVTHCADVVADLFGGIKKDEFLLVGSIIPPISLAEGDSFEYQLGDYPPLRVYF